MGRPKTEYDMVAVRIMGKFKATYATMADYFNVCERTIEREMAVEDGEFCRVYKKGNADLKLKLSEAQVKLAMGGNVTMQIWLGKQLLNQRDKSEIDNTHKFPTSIKIDFVKAEGEDDTNRNTEAN